MLPNSLKHLDPGYVLPLKILSKTVVTWNQTKTDTECPEDNQKCCPGKCGSRDCKVAITGDRPRCPLINPDIRCIVYNQQCNSDKDCDKGELCCFQPSCGTSCQKRAVPIPDPQPQCPPYRKDVKFKRYDKQCIGDKDCKYGQICCRVACGTACKPSSDPVCKPVLCRLHCEFGFEEDENGCNICKCKPNCLLPKKPGPCKAYFPRFYYDTKKKSCEKFIYGGCQGNDNNFKSLEECERKCNTEPEEPECPPVCEIACKFGNVLDKNGCPICKCKPECPPVCMIFCKFGNVVDTNGCPICKCKPNKKPPGSPRSPSPPPTTRPLPPAPTKPPQKKCHADPLPNAKCYQHTRICTDDSDCEGQCCSYGCYYKCLDPL